MSLPKMRGLEMMSDSINEREAEGEKHRATA